MPSLQSLVQLLIFSRNRDEVVVAEDVRPAILFQQADQFRTKYQPFKRIVHAIIVGLDIHDRSVNLLVDNLVVFGFATSHADQTMCHRLQGIHGWRVAIELVEDHIAPVHHLHILIEGNALCLAKHHLVGKFAADSSAARSMMSVPLYSLLPLLMPMKSLSGGVKSELGIDSRMWMGKGMNVVLSGKSGW